jgi:hypothetical protein
MSTFETSDVVASKDPKFNVAAIINLRPYVGNFPIYTEIEEFFHHFIYPRMEII